ncbi:MAG: hypothetical protein FWB77_00130 [Treponema sp.]|nr:hypothetical protein [Treponema sp.]
MKDRAIMFGWVIGLLLLISVLWIATQPIQARHLLRTINNVLISNDDSRRVSAYIQPKAGKASIFGYWYSILSSQDKLFVFTAFQDGILIPLGAFVSHDCIVKEIIPLSAHAVQVFDTLPKSVLNIYTARIEEAAHDVTAALTEAANR